MSHLAYLVGYTVTQFFDLLFAIRVAVNKCKYATIDN